MTPQTISRRSVLRGSAVSGVAAVVGFVVARGSGAASSKATTTAANGYGVAADGAAGGRFLAHLDQVPPDGGLVLVSDKIVLTRESGGTVRGFSAVCTHQGCVVGPVSGEVITCPCHGSRFDARTGAVLGGPATRPLPKIAVAVRDNNVYTG